jgi:hypothetical protein
MFDFDCSRALPPPTTWYQQSADRLRAAVFPCLWLFIAYVSVHDGYLVALNRAVILEVELNPLGLKLLHAAGGEVWALLAVKTAGTVLACSLLLLLFWHSRRIGSAVAAGLAGFQLGLLLFLTLM